MLDELIKEREQKKKRYEAVHDPYPATVGKRMPIQSVVEKFAAFEKGKKKVDLLGRIFALRNQGKIIFLDVKDGSGGIQFVLSEEGCKEFPLIKETLDMGDFVEARGTLFITKKGEKSLRVEELKIIAKSLRPLPVEWFGLKDTETLLRKRYLDLLLNEDTKAVFRAKALFWEVVRNALHEEDFLEVEMPVLESVPGGADAEPFVTHHNALDRDFYLRISLELPLKKMLVGGFERVFEIGRIFRNEGIDREHLQDYTQMECYAAYTDYDWMMEFVEKLYKTIIKKITGGLKTVYNNGTIDWSKKWEKQDYYELFKKYAGIDLRNTDEKELREKAKSLHIEITPELRKGKLIDLIYKKTVRPMLVVPCFLVNPPIEIEPLAKRLPDDPTRVARFQVMAGGTELGKGFSELNDPADQRKRFEEQMKLRDAGDTEAQQLDESFLEALEYGMPPASGFGMSERLFAVIMNRPIRETVIFPLMKEKE